MRTQLKYFRILSLFVVIPFLGAGARAAQPQGGEGGPRGEEGRRGPMSPDDRLKQMTKNFSLTADQQAKIKPILVDAQKKMEEARNNSSGDRQAMRGKMMQIMQEANSQARGQLDDKQKEKFDKLKQERMQRMQDRRSGGPGEPGGDNAGPPPPPQN
jgi:Spy/CpxP family protein refolding chaperone